MGGVLCVENPYVAKARIQRLRKYLPVSQNHLGGGPVPPVMEWEESLEFSNVLTLSEDLSEAMRMMVEIDEIVKEFPGLDCGACGAPTCRAFAEDVVRGNSKKTGCIFVYRRQMQQMADTLFRWGTGSAASPGGEVTRHGRPETGKERMVEMTAKELAAACGWTLLPAGRGGTTRWRAATWATC